jgi:ubiquinone/menaquinone biosynthesis C-methylase UbiE
VLEWVDREPLAEGARALDVGCGAGELTAELVARSWAVDACDVSEEMLALVRGRALEQVTAHQADVYELPFEDATFDLVLALGVVPWLHTPERGLRELCRVVRLGGHVIVTADNVRRLTHLLDPLRTPLLTPVRRRLKRVLRPARASGGLHRQHELGAFRRLLEDAGLEVEEMRTIGFGPFTILGKAFLPARLALRLNDVLQRRSDRGQGVLAAGGAHLLALARRPEPATAAESRLSPRIT